VEFLLVYIREAHPADGWSVEVNPRLRYVKQPETSVQRFQVANTCVTELEISFPCLIDRMDNATMEAYNALPDRLYLVGEDGRIAFKGRHGPFGFEPAKLEAAIERELASPGSGR
jgi:hypothetical protein